MRPRQDQRTPRSAVGLNGKPRTIHCVSADSGQCVLIAFFLPEIL
jgi:hypothetical protein